MNVKTSACTTNIENVRVSRTPAVRPTLSTISSTRLQNPISTLTPDRNYAMTYPLQLIRVPIAADSRRLKPVSFAVTAHPTNFETNAITQIRMT